jgi:hypothetical protein
MSVVWTWHRCDAKEEMKKVGHGDAVFGPKGDFSRLVRCWVLMIGDFLGDDTLKNSFSTSSSLSRPPPSR